jgi:hypothetical protein
MYAVEKSNCLDGVEAKLTKHTTEDRAGASSTTDTMNHETLSGPQRR